MYQKWIYDNLSLVTLHFLLLCFFLKKTKVLYLVVRGVSLLNFYPIVWLWLGIWSHLLIIGLAFAWYFLGICTTFARLCYEFTGICFYLLVIGSQFDQKHALEFAPTSSWTMEIRVPHICKVLASHLHLRFFASHFLLFSTVCPL